MLYIIVASPSSYIITLVLPCHAFGVISYHEAVVKVTQSVNDPLPEDENNELP